MHVQRELEENVMHTVFHTASETAHIHGLDCFQFVGNINFRNDDSPVFLMDQ